MKNKTIYKGVLYIADKDRLLNDLMEMKGSSGKLIDTPVLKYRIEYPLHNPVEVEEVQENGWSLGSICMSIANQYRKIYNEEDETTEVPAGDMLDIGLLNRNQTNGRHGIWGHVIEDLCIEILEITEQTPEYTRIKLYMGS